MKFTWLDYEEKYASVIESWLDDETKRFTGCDEGWNSFYEYWKNEDNLKLGENFWSKIIFDDDIPIAVTAFSLYKNCFTVMEYIVDPIKRGKGYGSAVLKELIYNGNIIVGMNIEKAKAVVYPNNIASQKVFENAGFSFDHAHPDGDAWYYVFMKSATCFCGHDCSRCLT